MATLSEADGYEKNGIELKPDIVQLKPDTVQLEPDTVERKPDTLESNLTVEQQTEKLQMVLTDLRVSTLPIPEQVRKRLVDVVKENLGAFATSPTGLGKNLSSGAYDQDQCSKTIQTQTSTNSICTTPVP